MPNGNIETFERRKGLGRFFCGDRKVTDREEANRLLDLQRAYNSERGAEAIGIIGRITRILSEPQYFEGAGHS